MSDIRRALDIYSVIASGGDDEFMALTVIPGPPPNKQRPKFTKRGTTYQPKEDREAELRTREYLRELTATPYTGNVALGCVFFRPNYQRIDTDNMLKHVCDAANGVLWVDDSQVTAVFGITELDAELPRTIVVIGRHRSTMARGSDLTRECASCRRPFSVAGKSPLTRTCSKACATRLKGYQPLNEPVPCGQCGRPFVRASQYQKLCSAECRAAKIAGSNRARSGTVPMSECLDCGRTLAHRRGGRCRECWRASVREAREGSK